MNFTYRFFEEYLEAMDQAHKKDQSPASTYRLLQCYAELQYKQKGGSKCFICRAPVRLVIPVVVEKEGEEARAYPCLCGRCLEGERATSTRVLLQLGISSFEYQPIKHIHNHQK